MSEQKGVHKSRRTTDEAALEDKELGEIQGGSIFNKRQMDEQAKELEKSLEGLKDRLSKGLDKPVTGA